MRHLVDILALQRELVKRFQNVPALTGTIEEFLNTQNAGTQTVCLRQLSAAWEMLSSLSDAWENVLCLCITVLMSSLSAGGLKVWYKKHIRIFLATWNQLRVSLVTNGKYQPLCVGDVGPSTTIILNSVFSM